MSYDDHTTPGESVAGSAASPSVPRLEKRRTGGGAAASAPVAVEERAGGIGALRKHVDTAGRVHWFLTVADIEIEMTTRQLLSARQAERKIYTALIDLGFYDALPEPMSQRDWERVITAKITALGTPVGRARVGDAAWRMPWWRRPLLACRRLLRAA